MSQVGCAVASAGVTVSRVVGSRSRNGPPEAVSTRRRTSWGWPARSAWWIAACSLSIGRMDAPEAAASRRSTGPAATIASLLASARSAPAASAAAAGLRPAAPTIAVTTKSILPEPTVSSSASSPLARLVPAGSSPRSAAAASAPATTTRSGPNSRANSTRRAGRVPCAASTETRNRSGWLRATARVASPIEPVAPSTATLRRFKAGLRPRRSRKAPRQPARRRRCRQRGTSAASPASRCPAGRGGRRARVAGGWCP